jgi:hypothetical protein
MSDKPGGLESLGLVPAEPTVPQRRPRWLASSLRFAIVLLCFWVSLLGLQIFQAVHDHGVAPSGWVVIGVYAAGIILYVPSIVHFTRLRSRSDPSSAVRVFSFVKMSKRTDGSHR